MNLSDLKRLCDEATPGPWRNYPIHGNDYAEVFGPKPREDRRDRILLGSQPDAAFIAAARTYMPKLLAVAEAAERHYHTEQTDHEGCKICIALAALEAE